MYWLGRNSALTIQNKLMVSQQVLKLTYVYGIQLWGCMRKCEIVQIQRFQNKILMNVVNAPWYEYVRNNDLYRDLKVETVQETIKKIAVV